MFRCYFCKQVTPPKTTRHSVVIETRVKKYASRQREAKRRGFRDRSDGPLDRGGEGREILKEVDACPECAAKQHHIHCSPDPAADAVPPKDRPSKPEAGVK
ncbi:MAG: hypothetical protein MI861_21565 [Pirellulales bacterium]|nr:hypothetical protein [Pirellulales bacterium]